MPTVKSRNVACLIGSLRNNPIMHAWLWLTTKSNHACLTTVIVCSSGPDSEVDTGVHFSSLWVINLGILTQLYSYKVGYQIITHLIVHGISNLMYFNLHRLRGNDLSCVERVAVTIEFKLMATYLIDSYNKLRLKLKKPKGWKKSLMKNPQECDCLRTNIQIHLNENIIIALN